MSVKSDLTINISGRLMDFKIPKVMAILNMTPDSFYDGSDNKPSIPLERRIEDIIGNGADIIDVGGCSTRPGSRPPSSEEEWQRVEKALRCIRNISPDFPVSLDTYRSEIAKKGIEEFGVNIINDISGGTIDPEIWHVAAEKHVPYVLTHLRGTPEDMQNHSRYDNVVADIINEMSHKINELHRLGICDVIIDPGFGFSKDLNQNFEILSDLHEFTRIGLPLLVGLSRKSMIYKTLDCEPGEALTGTTVLNTVALMKGANILRVHDVKEASEAVKLISKLKKEGNDRLWN